MRIPCFILLSLLIAPPAVHGAENPIPNSSFEKLDDTGWATAWGRYNWGMEGSDATQKVDTTVAHTGKNSTMGINRTATARGGVYTHVPLGAGSWELSFWAKAAPGESGAVRCYLATAYSRSFSVGDKIVGSYADKSENFPLGEFRMQMAAIRVLQDGGGTRGNCRPAEVAAPLSGDMMRIRREGDSDDWWLRETGIGVLD
jgi:hypothetical protein